MVASLEKIYRNAGFHQIIDFINRSHICYALTKKPEVCVSFVKQFWRTAEIATNEDGNVKIHATIDDKVNPFQKGAFSPQWRFLIHIILHCLSPKKTAWEQFSSNIAAAIICLATNRRYAETQVQQHSRFYSVPSLTMKVFSNMKRSTKGFSDREDWVLEADLSQTQKIYQFCYTKLFSGQKLESQGRSSLMKRIQVSTAGGTATYSRRSAEKRKDKGKVMIEEEPKKKSKRSLSKKDDYAEALRLEEQMNEEQRAQIARDAEIARQWEEEEKKKAMDEAKTAKVIDWNDPSVIRYHSLKMKPKSIAQARRNMIKYLKNQGKCQES
ncbi:hypothetical protein Tco_1111583 [Tanacetum coccineum]|uniref:No apical meristem-associated C-terminal domain-containing protein n=1 Tax=Tanacetum coccineum TaxID=301880 RepID=A0ABQ5IM11_9ASTR